MTPAEAIAEMRSAGPAYNIEVRPIVVQGLPDACNVWLCVGVQQFCVTSIACDDREEAEAYVAMLDGAMKIATRADLFPALLAAVEMAAATLANSQRVDERFFYTLNVKKADIDALDAALSALARKVEEIEQ